MGKAASASSNGTARRAVYVSDETHEKLQEHRKKTGIPLSHAVETALETYFEVEGLVMEDRASRLRAALGRSK